MIDCTQLVGRLRAICEHTSGLPREMEDAYIALWEGNPPPAPPSLDCVYRGEPIDWLECEPCARNGKAVRIKVYACQLFQRCVLMDGTAQKFCGTCESRVVTHKP